MDFIAGGLAAMGAGMFSNPFDLIKTRMQLQGELQKRGDYQIYYKNTLHAAYTISKNDGILTLQRGLRIGVILHGVRNCIRLGAYQWLHKNHYLSDDDKQIVYSKTFIAATVTGVSGAFLGSPLFLIKTQLQSKANQTIAVGYQHEHSGLIQAFSFVYQNYGIRGLWRGTNGTVLRATFGSGSQLTSFELTKDYLKQTNDIFKTSPILTSFMASIVGGFFQTINMTPFDLVSTRLYNQGVDRNGKGLLYDGVVDCFVKIWKTEGLFGFYKGVGANYMRLGPHSAICLVFWDILKDLQLKYNTS